MCLEPPLQGIWPATHTCAVTQDQSGDPVVCRPALYLLNYTSQGLSNLEIMFHSLAIFSLSKIVRLFFMAKNHDKALFFLQLVENYPMHVINTFYQHFHQLCPTVDPYGHPPQKDIVIKYLKDENHGLSIQEISIFKSKHSSES